MRTLAHLAVVAVCALALTGCELFGDKDKENASKACGPAPTAMSGSPTLLPASFPAPDGVTYVSEKKDGPSTIATAFRAGELQEAYDEYKSALSSNGWTVAKDEKDPADAEVNFSGSSTTGQVKLQQECKDRTTVTITVRPA